jgi:hypothetical protein
VLGTGVRDSGEAVQNGFGAAADAAGGIPVVGGDVGDALRDACSGTGGEVAQAGSDGEGKVHDLANLLGVLFFAIPASILLIATLPGRIRQFRELNATRATAKIRSGISRQAATTHLSARPTTAPASPRSAYDSGEGAPVTRTSFRSPPSSAARARRDGLAGAGGRSSPSRRRSPTISTR